MKKLFLFAIPIAFILASCHKAVLKPGDYISATIDGVNENFNTGDSTRNIGTSGVFISGANAATSDRIIFYFTSTKGIATGTYTFPNTDNSAGVQIMYEPAGNATNYYYTYYTEPSGSNPGLNYPGTITITQVSDASIQGTLVARSYWFLQSRAATLLKPKQLPTGSLACRGDLSCYYCLC
jgi:hypothetical protein